MSSKESTENKIKHMTKLFPFSPYPLLLSFLTLSNPTRSGFRLLKSSIIGKIPVAFYTVSKTRGIKWYQEKPQAEVNAFIQKPPSLLS